MPWVTVIVGGHKNFDELVNGLKMDGGHGVLVCHT